MILGTVSTARRVRLSLHCRMVRDVGEKKIGVSLNSDLLNTGDAPVGMPLQHCFNFGFCAVNTLRQQSMCLLRRRSATDCLNYVSLPSAVLVCELQIPFIFPIFRHLSLAPDRAPTILSVTPHTTTSVLVRWQVC